MKILVVIILYAIFLISCSESPTKVENNNPEILTLEVFPSIVNPGDSVIVICQAIEPDGDSLFYDWFTDSRLRIKGTSSNEMSLYNTKENTRLFYPTKTVNEPSETTWVRCNVRDGVGGSSISKSVTIFIVNKDGNYDL